jgi:phosphotriesterase-related protein
VEITFENRWQMDYEWVDAPGNRYLLDRDVAVREMERMVKDGGQSVVEVSTHPMGTDPEGLREVSERSGVHIVSGVGRYIEEFMVEVDLEMGVDELVADFVYAIQKGYGDTAIRAGIIGEIGCSWPWTEAERRSIEAAVIAQQETGAALSIHPGRNPKAPFEIIESVKAAGADIPRTIMDHIDRRLFDINDVLRLAEYGCVLEFDVFGWENSRFSQDSDLDLSSDGVRLTAIRALIDAGHLDRIVVAHDIAWRTRQVEFGGHGYGHIYRNVVPMMHRRGFTKEEIDAILVDNPARLLAFA